MTRVFIRAMVLSLLALTIPTQVSAAGEKILAFKDSIPYSGHKAGIQAALALLRGWASTHSFTVDTTVFLSDFNDTNLTKYSAVVFLYPEPYSPTNPNIGLMDTMSAEEGAAFKKWILTGKGVLGVHTHSRLNGDWEWYVKEFMGMKYINDIGPRSSTYHVADTNEFLTLGMPRTFTDNQQIRIDSLFWTEADTSYKILIRADESDYTTSQKQAFYPFVYRHNYQGARFFGLAPGHNASTWNTGSNWNQLYLNGILYALNRPGYGTTSVSTGPVPVGFALQRITNGKKQTLRFGLPKKERVVIRVYNPEGKLLSRLVNRSYNAGSHSVPLPAGLRGSLYIVDFKAGDYHKTLKIVR
jgi:type 1 glutamine amidotransferase